MTKWGMWRGALPAGCQVQSRGFKRVFSSQAPYSLVQEVTAHFTDEKTEGCKLPEVLCRRWCILEPLSF